MITTPFSFLTIGGGARDPDDMQPEYVKQAAAVFDVCDTGT
jgi:hypothetical protein